MDICGTCEYNVYNREDEDFICNNKDSENYGLPIGYNDLCDCYGEKE